MMLQNNKLLIDKDCPMCSIYGYCFTQLKMVDKSTVAPYQTIECNHSKHIDMSRAKNEIALFDVESKSTLYGLDAFVHIFKNSVPFVAQILSIPFVYALFLKVYKFISYNRKVIYPSKINRTQSSCTPDFNLKYRVIYIAFSITISIGMLFILVRQNALNNSIKFELTLAYPLVIGAILFLVIYLKKSPLRKKIDYLGNLTTSVILTYIATFLLVAVLKNYFFLPQVLPTVIIIAVVFMLKEFIRRLNILQVNHLFLSSV